VLGAKWGEIDFTERTWTIPASRTKRGKEHIVPLSDRAIEILRSLDTGRRSGDTLIFTDRPGRQLGHVSMLRVLQTMEPNATVHGMRSTFKDWARERTSFSDEVSEHALAHGIPDKTRAAYRRYTNLDQRRRLMQLWSEYCEAEPTSTVVPIRA
jgi:integrase